MADPRDRDDDEGSSGNEPLSDSQRIQNLEKSLSTQKLISGGVGLIVLIMLTFFSVGYFALNNRVTSNSENAGGPQDDNINAILEEKFETYTKTLPSADDLSNKYGDQISALNIQLDELDVFTKKSSVAELRQLMLDREKSNQVFLFALSNGMLSLSKMVRGSRTWFQQYDSELTAAIKASKAREKSLKQLIALEKTRLKMVEQNR
ncbi:MAG: hypothetical protein KUG72_04070 [Pseudomonadales bacterium]|nr:hypothetical protein [Pseudomonadales bacterium]